MRSTGSALPLATLAVVLAASCQAQDLAEPQAPPGPSPVVSIPVPPRAAPEASPDPAPRAWACAWQERDGTVTGSGGEAFGRDSTWSGPIGASPLDLDGDEYADHVVNLGACGNWGDCVRVVLVGCGNDRYHAVWGPEYALGLTVVPGRHWLLVEDHRGASAGCDPASATLLQAVVSPAPQALVTWRSIESCGLERFLASWRDECPELPSACPPGSQLGAILEERFQAAHRALP